MINSMYRTKDDLISSSISGGRSHYPYRKPEYATEKYKYELSYGENFHTLAAVIFGSDEYWWIIADLNKVVDPFSIKYGLVANLPYGLVKKTGSKKFV